MKYWTFIVEGPDSGGNSESPTLAGAQDIAVGLVTADHTRVVRVHAGPLIYEVEWSAGAVASHYRFGASDDYAHPEVGSQDVVGPADPTPLGAYTYLASLYTPDGEKRNAPENATIAGAKAGLLTFIDETWSLAVVRRREYVVPEDSTFSLLLSDDIVAIAPVTDGLIGAYTDLTGGGDEDAATIAALTAQVELLTVNLAASTALVAAVTEERDACIQQCDLLSAPRTGTSVVRSRLAIDREVRNDLYNQ